MKNPEHRLTLLQSSVALRVIGEPDIIPCLPISNGLTRPATRRVARD